MVDLIDRIFELLAPVLGPIEIPYALFLRATGLRLGWGWRLVYDVLAILIIIWFVRWAYGRVLDLVRGDRLASQADIDALVGKHSNFTDAMHDPEALRATTSFLKKNKQWAKLGEAYAAINQHKRAASYFAKGKAHTRAAESMAKAGKPAQAANSLMKAGDFENAGRFYAEAGKYAQAAKAYSKAGLTARAAASWGQIGKYKRAVALFQEYFAAPRDDARAQLQAAQACFEMLELDKAKQALSDDDRKALLIPIARAFEQAEQFERAGTLYREAGALEAAGEAFVRARKLEAAMACYKEAGKPREAARIGGRFYEKSGRWREAGMAYAGGEEFQRAGECFAKADEPVRAAEYFERAGDHVQAGKMYARAQRYAEAVDALQQVAESDPQFDVSRGLLGRCFYQLHDYAHCSATLENHLVGKRVEKGNMDYFYMLALAKEQLGQLEASKELLYKIGAVDKSYRDLDQRISSIDSRISLLGTQAGATPSPAPVGDGGNPAVMSMVQNTLGERYIIEKELGRGGMGVVYLARDKQLDRRVALKFLGTLVDNNEEYRQRFVREAKSAAKINHPNIVAIYDISASQGKAYIAMEYVEGASLHQYIQKKGKLAPREALNYMAQACSALYAIHSMGIVHRDIKPDNIVIAKGGLVKLMDFGLAKAEDHRITKSNIVMGTPCYMSPEQAQGKDVDARADIYAMGLVLYEMLTGRVVFGDGDVIMRQITEMPPKLSEMVSDLPAELDEFAYKCIAKDPDERFANCKELVEAIRKLPLH